LPQRTKWLVNSLKGTIVSNKLAEFGSWLRITMGKSFLKGYVEDKEQTLG
jgi:hypothetical protein